MMAYSDKMDIPSNIVVWIVPAPIKAQVGEYYLNQYNVFVFTV